MSDRPSDPVGDDDVLAGDALTRLRQRVARARQTSLLARSEAAAGVLDVARSFVFGLAENEPVSGSQTWSDVGRRMPRSVAEAARAALDRALEIPQRATDRFYAEYGSSGSGRRAGGGSGLSGGERRVINYAERFFDQVPGGGVRLNRLVDDIVLETDYDRDVVMSIIKRNFVTSGNVVSKKRVVEDLESKDSVKDYMRDELTDRGFDDLREDVELSGLPELDEKAVLVAYAESRPVVLCYPVAKGQVDDSGLQEAAIFQANVLAGGQVAGFVWLSDGDSNYIYDVAAEQVVTKLPTAGEKASAAARRTPAKTGS